jgi:MoaA/NifB/PqqE/SkfB family radical SAM enzyme
MITKVLKTTLKSSVLGWQKPTHLILHVISFCNARCGMCFAWKRLNKKNDDMTLAEITKVAKELPGLTFLDISGGEPFLRSDLKEILQVFAKYSPEAYVNLPTNGLLTKEIMKMTEDILREVPLPISLNLSIDGLPQTHDRIRGVKGCFAQMQKTYQGLVKLKKKYPKLSLKVSTVVSNQNIDELGEFATWVKKKMPVIDFHTLILIRGEPRNSLFTLPPLARMEKEKALFYKIWRWYDYGQNLNALGSKVANTSHNFLLDQYLKTVSDKKMTIPCLGGRAHSVVYANGDVAMCELRPAVGNLRKVNFNFNKLWNNPEAKKQRLAIMNNACFCTHGCNWTDNLFFNPKVYPRLAWEVIKGLY